MFDTSWKQATEAFTKANEAISKEWEQHAARWWDATLRDASTLESMKNALGALCAAKERSDQALEHHWATWRLPSSTDVERLAERLADLDERMARIEEHLLALRGGAAPAPAAPKPAKKAEG